MPTWRPRALDALRLKRGAQAAQPHRKVRALERPLSHLVPPAQSSTFSVSPTSRQYFPRSVLVQCYFIQPSTYPFGSLYHCCPYAWTLLSLEDILHRLAHLTFFTAVSQFTISLPLHRLVPYYPMFLAVLCLRLCHQANTLALPSARARSCRPDLNRPAVSYTQATLFYSLWSVVYGIA